MTWIGLALLAQLSAAGQAYPVPDKALTPGAVRPMNKAQVCATKWGTDERKVTESMKRRVARAYGIPDAEWRSYRYDHVISRSMAGADVVENLYPQTKADSKVKDRLELLYDRLVCAGKISLRQAQRELANDWRLAYERRIGPLPLRDAGRTP